MSDPTVTDHAVVRYLERIVGLDVEALRAAIAADCGRAQGAPCVRAEHARYIVRGKEVVSVFDRETVPHWTFLARIQRGAR
jgi:hypothetical protein